MDHVHTEEKNSMNAVTALARATSVESPSPLQDNGASTTLSARDWDLFVAEAESNDAPPAKLVEAFVKFKKKYG